MHHTAQVKLYRGFWYAVWTEDGKTKRQSLKTKDYEAACRRLEYLKRFPKGDLIRDAAALYLIARQETAVDPERLANAWKAAGPFFGHLRPAQVTKHLCREYIAHRRRLGRGDGTISRELGMVRAALYYVNKGRFAEFECPPRPPANTRYLTHEEYYRLLCAAMAPHIELFIILALATAGRACAVLELTWNRVDFKRGLIYLGRQEEARRKGRAIVPLLDTVRPYLNKGLDAAETDYVIEYRGVPVKSIKHGFKRTAKRAGLVNVTPHSLRHTAAVWMAESGRPMSEIAQYLGHSDSQSTETVYARYSPHYLRRAAAALEIPSGFRTQFH